MPAATGSIAFLGAARFQGFWNASTNAATGSALDGAKFTATSIGNIEGLFETGSSTGGGYGAGGVGITASAGDYWQVSSSGTHNVDGQTNWSQNDWCIYSGSAAGGGTWKKLAFQDTIASIIVGDLSASDKFNLTGSSDMHVSFIKGTDDVTVAVSGSENFTFDYNTNQLLLTGNLLIADDKKIYFGASNDGSVEYDEDRSNYLIISGSTAGLALSGSSVGVDGKFHLSVAALGGPSPSADSFYILDATDGEVKSTTINATLGEIIADDGGLARASSQLLISGSNISSATVAVSADEVLMLDADGSIKRESFVDLASAMAGSGIAASSGQLTVSVGDDEKLYFGAGNDAYIEYNEDGDDLLVISGSTAGLVLSGSATTIDSNATLFKTAGGAAYLSISSFGVFPLTAGGLNLGGVNNELGDVYVADDKKIYLGSDQDAHITYDEDTTNYLIVSGSDAGLALSGSIIGIDGELSGLLSGTVNFKIKMDGNSTGEFSDQTGNQFLYLVPAGNLRGPAINAVGAGNSGLGFATSGSSKARIFHEEEGSKYLVVSGSTEGLALSGSTVGIDGALQLSDAGALPASNGGLAAAGGTLLVSGSNIADGTIAVASDQMVFLDADGSLKRETIADLATAMAGTGILASSGQLELRFAEISAVTPMASTDSVMILDNGSGTKRVTVTTMGDYLAASNGGLANTSGQLSVSGSNIADGTVAVASDQIVFLDSDGSLKRETIADFTSGIAGDGLDASSGQLTVDLSEVIASDGANRVLTSDNDGTATGEANLTFDGVDLFVTGGIKMADDKRLHFGAENNTSIYYDEAGQDMLVISGSTFGTTLSGSLVRVVDKLAVGTDTNAAKTSGILVVQADAADTTNGLIATFKSGDSDYCRVNIDNSTANGDTQFTFMSNGSSKWSVGNMGSNETFHIKSGFGDFADADQFVINASDGTSLNTIVTASVALLVPDDKKLYLGTGHDAHIEYNENGDDLLIISGSTAGMALSGSTVTVVGGDTILEAAGKPVARAVGPARSNVTNISNAFSFVKPVIKVTADTQLYAGDSGALVMFSDAAATITLPDSGDAANLGVWYSFAVSSAVAGTKKIVVTDTTNERFAGIIKMIDTDTSNALSFQAAAGAANVSITFNGTTTGVMGSAITIVATGTDEWTVVDSEVLHTGDVANPFGTS